MAPRNYWQANSTLACNLARLRLLPPTRPGSKSASRSAHLDVALGGAMCSFGNAARAPLLLLPLPLLAPFDPAWQIPCIMRGRLWTCTFANVGSVNRDMLLTEILCSDRAAQWKPI